MLMSAVSATDGRVTEARWLSELALYCSSLAYPSCSTAVHDAGLTRLLQSTSATTPLHHDILPRPCGGAEYCGERVCLCVDAHISKTTRPISTKFSLHTACGCGSVVGSLLIIINFT